MGTVLEVRDIIRNYSKKGDGARPSEDDIKVIRGLSLKVEKKIFLELWEIWLREIHAFESGTFRPADGGKSIF